MAGKKSSLKGTNRTKTHRSNSERLRNNMNEEIETKLDELRNEFEISIKDLKVRQEFNIRDIERKVEEFVAHTTRQHDELNARSSAELMVVDQRHRHEIELLQIEINNLKEKLDGNN